MYTFSPENQLVIAACSPYPDIARLKQTIAKIDNWDTACAKLIKKGVAPLMLDLLEKNPDLAEHPHGPKSRIEDLKKELNQKSIPFTLSGNNEKESFHKTVPQSVVAKLKQAYLKTVSRSMILYNTFTDIAIALNKNGIKAVALKGIYLAEHLYPRIGLRQFSDIDLLFRNEDVDAALEVFRGLGFRMESPAFDEHVRSVHEPAHLPHLIRNGISVELHTRLHGPFNEYNLDESEFFERAIPVKINNQAFYAFDKNDLFIHLCTHLDKHFNSTHVQFYSFADIGRLMSSIHVNELLERSDKYGARNTVFRILTILHFVFDAPLPSEIKKGFTDKVSPVLLERLSKHLDDRVEENLSAKTHLQYLKRFNNSKDKLNYLIGVTFPSKEYMVRAYKISNTNFYWLWYPIRWWIGFKGLFSKSNLRDN